MLLLPAQLNSRPFGPWSETLLGGDIADDDDVVEVGGSPSFEDTFSSLAGVDLLKYYNDIRSRKSGMCTVYGALWVESDTQIRRKRGDLL